MKRIMHNRIFVLIIGLMLLVCLGFIIFLPKTNNGQTVVVRYNGEIYGKYDLYQDKEIVIEVGEGSNHLVIKDGTAFIDEADCPEQVCINTGAISKEYPAVIVCLPHKIVISIE